MRLAIRSAMRYVMQFVMWFAARFVIWFAKCIAMHFSIRFVKRFLFGLSYTIIRFVKQITHSAMHFAVCEVCESSVTAWQMVY